jgi:hypothetical protein
VIRSYYRQIDRLIPVLNTALPASGRSITDITYIASACSDPPLPAGVAGARRSSYGRLHVTVMGSAFRHDNGHSFPAAR